MWTRSQFDDDMILTRIKYSDKPYLKIWKSKIWCLIIAFPESSYWAGYPGISWPMRPVSQGTTEFLPTFSPVVPSWLPPPTRSARSNLWDLGAWLPPSCPCAPRHPNTCSCRWEEAPDHRGRAWGNQRKPEENSIWWWFHVFFPQKNVGFFWAVQEKTFKSSAAFEDRILRVAQMIG